MTILRRIRSNEPLIDEVTLQNAVAQLLFPFVNCALCSVLHGFTMGRSVAISIQMEACGTVHEGNSRPIMTCTFASIFRHHVSLCAQ